MPTSIFASMTPHMMTTRTTTLYDTDVELELVSSATNALNAATVTDDQHACDEELGLVSGTTSALPSTAATTTAATAAAAAADDQKEKYATDEELGLEPTLAVDDSQFCANHDDATCNTDEELGLQSGAFETSASASNGDGQTDYNTDDELGLPRDAFITAAKAIRDITRDLDTDDELALGSFEPLSTQAYAEISVWAGQAHSLVDNDEAQDEGTVFDDDEDIGDE